MRARTMVVSVVVIAGLGVAAYGVYIKHANAAAAFAAANPITTTTTLPPGTPVGFNASKTKFVLPHNLGLLPAPELTLARAVPAYASGLGNASDWTQISIGLFPRGASQHGGTSPTSLWVYIGATASEGSIPPGFSMNAWWYAKAAGLDWNNSIGFTVRDWSVTVLRSSPVVVRSFGLHVLVSGSSGTINVGTFPTGSVFVGASRLEIQAAPVGTLAVGGTSLPAFCVPVPEAFVSGGKVINTSTFPAMTAGPSTVFASRGARGPDETDYDKGAASCNSFH